ncbi:hypothetical protein EYZ11_007946 [Aspergillus tanneri]|uniref:Norsolorinic acid ketoreductase nor1 n=1 Tax=Aspergillus tanneri TaxID=1220188 RepID=A0A4S3JBQ4_9EURO|nr:uncharacterized protein ATNIH1004_009501 [Aspergillus tanneri]KAA8642749.1 hypothetical protein ATNIH1004_009501 [Aspergillus tanneri]THC92583.1 hypothetical protein EYZ11_007946 [Aspergillus tanneri]
MSDSTVVFISGVARGIGRALTEAYLSRPNHTVIGSVRDRSAPNAKTLEAFPAAAGSRLLLVSIESTSAEDVTKAVRDIEAAGVTHLDIVIANAGICPTPTSIATVDVKDVTEAFTINTVGPIILYQALLPLLKKSTGSPKWLSVSTGAASLERLEVHHAYGVAAYGISKAGMNWFTLAAHSSEKWLTAFAVHPGLVQTDMGNMGARMQGMELAPNTLEESTSKTIAILDSATREKTSGKFINVIDGTEFPW